MSGVGVRGERIEFTGEGLVIKRSNEKQIVSVDEKANMIVIRYVYGNGNDEYVKRYNYNTMAQFIEEMKRNITATRGAHELIPSLFFVLAKMRRGEPSANGCCMDHNKNHICFYMKDDRFGFRALWNGALKYENYLIIDSDIEREAFGIFIKNVADENCGTAKELLEVYIDIKTRMIWEYLNGLNAIIRDSNLVDKGDSLKVESEEPKGGYDI